MWQSVKDNPNEFPGSLEVLREYINGGNTEPDHGLKGKKEDGTTTAHSIDATKKQLISEYNTDNRWVYPAH